MSGHDDSKKKVVHATVCAPAAESLRAFCMAHGTTVTAFLDGLGHAVCPWLHAPMSAMDEAAPTLAEALRLARQVDGDRRSRDPLIRPPSSDTEPVNGAGLPG